jgi:manganese transport protein
MALFNLPTTATAPFCPSEVKGTVTIPAGASPLRKVLAFAGPGLLVSVGYMDPGNWATDIEGGSRYGYGLLFVVVLASLAAMVLQSLCLRLGIVTGRDLAQATRERYGARAAKPLWLAAELSIVACDLAEVLGGALAFKLLFGWPLWVGVLVTSLDALIVLGLKDQGFRQMELIVLSLIAIIGVCFAVELVYVGPDLHAMVSGLLPKPNLLHDSHALYLSIGILGATVMPHNLYLHSSIVQTRRVDASDAGKSEAIRYGRFDTIVSLSLALLINAAILVLAAEAFHANGHADVASIEDAHQLLTPVVGTAIAGILFGVALLASGQSSTITGTIAGQVILEGFLKLKIPCWQRRVITRGLALVPAMLGVLLLGENAVGRMLVMSQVVLSLQLPFALFPLIAITGDKKVMGRFVNKLPTKLIAWLLFALITAANLRLLVDLFAGD